MSHPQPAPLADRRKQILQAAMVCFAGHGFHQSSMHDISKEAGISVGLIYRYFQNKDAVISAMADEHKAEIQELLKQARQAPSLLEAFDILFTWNCCDNSPQVVTAFVVDLFAEAGRNPGVANLVRDVARTAKIGVTDLIARSPEAADLPANLTPGDVAEMIFALNDGLLMRDVLTDLTPTERRARQSHCARNLWTLLFAHQAQPA